MIRNYKTNIREKLVQTTNREELKYKKSLKCILKYLIHYMIDL